MVGVDASRGMLAEADQRWPDAAVEWTRGDVLEPLFHDAFDLAVCFGALGHILPADEERFLQRVHALLRARGRFAVVTGHPPPWSSLGRWLAIGFNTAMVVRNLLIRPPFVMYYLTFLLPAIARKMERVGFRVEERALWSRWPTLRLVIATKE